MRAVLIYHRLKGSDPFTRQEMMNSVLGDGGRFDAFSCGAEQRHG